MAVAADSARPDTGTQAGTPARRAARATIVPAALVAIAISPLVVGSMAIAGETWVPMGDWASMVLRTSQVGTAETPLVGAYSLHGFAHPGPLHYWVGAGPYRLFGEDPRALLWTGALVNAVTVVALGAVAWRRGRGSLLVATVLLVALLLHGLGSVVTVDLWNAHTPQLPFLLTLMLAWDAALGRRRAIVEAVVPATYAMQAHLAFVPLVAVVALWVVAWRRWGPGLAGDPAPAEPAGPADLAGSGGRWRRRAAVPTPALVLLAVLWAAPAADALVDMHNPARAALALATEKDTLGLGRGPALVGTYLLPSSWSDGEPTIHFAVHAADLAALVATVAALAACLVVARRRKLTDAAALVTLSLALVAVAVPATSQLNFPTWSYLTQWLKVVAAFAWFGAGWTLWRAAEPALAAAPVRRRLSGAVAGLAVVAATAWSWGDAAGHDVPRNQFPGDVAALRAAARHGLRPGTQYRVEVSAGWDGYFQGLVYWLMEDGHDVVTSDGAGGLKWGHAGRWVDGQPWEQALVVAAHYPGTPLDDFEDCVDDPTLREIYRHDPWTPADHEWAEDLRFRRVGDPDSITAADEARAEELRERGPEVAMVVGDHLCGLDDPDDPRATA